MRKHFSTSNTPSRRLKLKSSLTDIADIPIVHELYETYKLWHYLILKFPKSERYTLGQRCGSTLLQLFEYVLTASSTKDIKIKLNLLSKASTKLDILRLLIRLAKDCDCLTNRAYLELQAKLHKIGKMLGGWIKSIN
ncbi:MAG: four helix bundle protein [Patescibacteria group bacterium]|nr:four helix bundle protein [Patescibacteria group bacterium]